MTSASGDLNVLSVIHFPVFGGPMNRNALVAEDLNSRGVRTHIVLPDEPGNAAPRFRALGIEPVQIPLKRLRSHRDPAVHIDYARSFRRDVRNLRRLIRELDIDVVLVNGSANPHAAFAARAEGTPVVWQLLDTFPPYSFLRIVMPLILRFSDVIMTNGMTVAAVHPGALAFEGPLISFGPCVPIERFTPVEGGRARARKELGLSADDFVVGNVNNLNPMKGHRTFLAAAARLRKERDARFVILGASGDADYVDSLVEYAGELGLEVGRDVILRDGGSRVHELAQAFDLFWLTSEPRSEGMSTSLAEAQALGIPVIATRTGAVHECLVDGVTGHLVAPHDAEAIARRSIEFMDDPALREQFSEAAFAHIRRNFSVAATAERHLEAYRAAVSAKNR